jgi:hypothetical protein
MTNETIRCAWVAAACAVVAPWVGGGTVALLCALLLIGAAVLLAARAAGSVRAFLRMRRLPAVCLLAVLSTGARLLLRLLEPRLPDEAGLLTTWFPDPAYEQAVAALRYLRGVLVQR